MTLCEQCHEAESKNRKISEQNLLLVLRCSAVTCLDLNSLATVLHDRLGTRLPDRLFLALAYCVENEKIRDDIIYKFDEHCGRAIAKDRKK
jgi:hypothetical protein